MMKVFAVFDVKSASFGTPMFLISQGVALRGFSDACADEKSMLAQHPEDFAMYELGSYDANSGKIECHPQPKHLYSAAAVVAQIKAARRVVQEGPSPSDLKGEEVKA